MTDPKIPGYPPNFTGLSEAAVKQALHDPYAPTAAEAGAINVATYDALGTNYVPAPKPPLGPVPEPTSPAPLNPVLKNFQKIGTIDVIGGRVSIVASVAHCSFSGAAALETAVRALHKSTIGYTSAPYAGAAERVTNPSAGMVIQPTWGDGAYPVYAQLDKMKKVRGIFIDFEQG